MNLLTAGYLPPKDVYKRQAQQCGFTGARGPDDAHNLSFFYRKGDILEDFVVPEFFIAVIDFQ